MTAKDRKAMRASLDVVHQSGDDRTGESANLLNSCIGD